MIHYQTENASVSFDWTAWLSLVEQTDFMLKRMMDVALALLGLTLSAPVMLLVALCIKAESPGKLIFKSLRVGQYGRFFWMYKFRTMHQDAAQWLEENREFKKQFEVGFKMKNDPRVTKFGQFLRRTCLDELPQLLNVLRGEMSIVGPRPILMEEITRVGPERLSVLPGLTGLWQISGKNDLTYEKKLELDNHYVENRNIALDCKIILWTFPAIIQGKGFF